MASIGKHSGVPAMATAAPAAQTAGVAPSVYQSYVPAYNASLSKPKRRKGKVAAVVVATTIGLLATVYFGGVALFSNVFYPNTALAGNDISFMTVPDAAEVASQVGSDYTVHVVGDGLNFTVSSADAGVKVDGMRVANMAMADNNPWWWPLELNERHDESENITTQYSEAGLAEVVYQNVEAYNADATDPVDATVSFNAATSLFSVVPEQAGTKVDPEAVIAVIGEAIIEKQGTAELSAAQLKQPARKSSDPSLAAAADTANTYLAADIELVLGDDSIPVTKLDHAQIAQWITLDENLNPSFDSGALDAWSRDLSMSIDSIGKARQVTSPYGETYTVSGGTYGWETDTEATIQQVREAVTAGYVGQLRIPCVQEAYTWRGFDQPDWGAHAEVDISAQHAWFFDTDGNILWESDVVTGRPDGAHNTTTGCWRILFKRSPSVLKGDIDPATGKPEYETQVQYWMPFTATGIGFHDATWQSAFGGSRYAEGYGSHGCVNLPYSAAEQLYSLIAENNCVIVHE